VPLSDTFVTAPHGPHFGDYETLRELGRGAMGVVYKAWDPGLRCFVAIKTLSPEFAREARANAFLHREATSAALMQHENVVHINAFKFHEQQPYLVMEYVHGKDCERLLKAPNRLGVAVALSLLLDVARGLEHAHAPSRQIVHRDIKPSNLMLSHEGVGKIMDFGLGRRVTGDIRLTVADGMVGTIAYMSPEQANGKDVELPSDVFSLGVVAYRMLAGRRPFDDSRVESVQAMEMLRRVREDEPAPLEEQCADASVFLARLVHAMLAKDPARRPAASEVVTELQQEIRRREIGSPREVLQEFVRPVVGPDTELDEYLKRTIPTSPEPPLPPPPPVPWLRIASITGIVVALAIGAAPGRESWPWWRALSRPDTTGRGPVPPPPAPASLVVRVHPASAVVRTESGARPDAAGRLSDLAGGTIRLHAHATGFDAADTTIDLVADTERVLEWYLRPSSVAPLVLHPAASELLHEIDHVSGPLKIKLCKEFIEWYPHHDKAAEKQYQIGYEYLQAGDTENARAALIKTRTHYPGTLQAGAAADLLENELSGH